MTVRILSEKQIAVMQTLYAANSFADVSDNDKMDIDQLIDNVSYTVTKEAIQHTLRSLKKRGYIEKGNTVLRRGKKRIVWSLSKSGQNYLVRH
jgi:DNA-binding PadR family transcriptional regulator